MVLYQFMCVFPCRLIQRFVFPVVQQKVVSDAAAYETLLDIWNLINFSVDIE